MKNRAEKQNMTTASAAASDVGEEAAATGYARLIAFQNNNVDALVRFHHIWRDGAVEWSNDLLEFMGRQLQRQPTATSWQVNGATPFEAIASHLKNCQSCAEQCLEQTAKFLNLAAKVSRDSRMQLERHATSVLKQPGRDHGSLGLREGNAHPDGAMPDGDGERQ